MGYSGNKGYKPRNKARYAGGRDITEPDYYDHWADLHAIQKKIKSLKADLKRDCIPYYKYDELVLKIEDYKEKIKEKDKLKELT